MKIIPVASTNIEAIGYDEATLILRVVFRNGSVYEYLGVPLKVFGEFKAAPSKGRFVNSALRRRYRYRRIR